MQGLTASGVQFPYAVITFDAEYIKSLCSQFAADTRSQESRGPGDHAALTLESQPPPPSSAAALSAPLDSHQPHCGQQHQAASLPLLLLLPLTPLVRLLLPPRRRRALPQPPSKCAAPPRLQPYLGPASIQVTRHQHLQPCKRATWDCNSMWRYGRFQAGLSRSTWAAAAHRVIVLAVQVLHARRAALVVWAAALAH